MLRVPRICAPTLLAVGLLAGTPAWAGGDQAPEAAFERRSYAPGETAWLKVWRGSARTVRVYRVGAAWDRARRDVLAGVAVTAPRRVVGANRIRIEMGEWPSGLYVARLQGAGGVGAAPFVLRPRRLGQNRVAVVLPTNTWAAYNLRDVDGNGVGDSWYASPAVRSVDLTRPFLDGGVPPRFRGYDRGFLRWLQIRGHRVDVLSDDDLERVGTGDRLARLYGLVVFPGHEEYVTTHAYDIVERYRDLGGDLMFLSANNFFYRVERRGNQIFKLGRWRDLGRPEAALIGVQYVDWNQNRYPNTPYRVVGANRAPWLFAGTGLRNGHRFGTYGIEIDARTSRSPRGLHLLARIDDAFGPGKSAEMTYYETRAGARVFAAGVINFGGSALWPATARMLDNLWARLAENPGG